MSKVISVLVKNGIVKEGKKLYFNTDELIFEVDSHQLKSTYDHVLKLIKEGNKNNIFYFIL